MEIDSIMCLVCQSQVESIFHIFLLCPCLRIIWLRIANWWNVDLPNEASIMAYISYADSIGGATVVRKAFDAVVTTTFWCLWRFRNSLLFGTVRPKLLEIFDDIVKRN